MKNMSYNALLALVEFLYTNDIDTRVRPETVTDLLRCKFSKLSLRI